MMDRKLAACLCLATAVIGAVLPTAAMADDAKTGFFAGLGFSAADGKTSLGTGAGTIEASLLISDAILVAGAEVRRITAAAADGHSTVLLLGHSDTLDFTMARAVASRLHTLNGSLPQGDCMLPPITVKTTTTTTKMGNLHLFDLVPGGDAATPATTQTTTETKNGLQKADIAPALSTSISVSGITLTADDRMLINAVQMGKAKPVWAKIGEPPSAPGTTSASAAAQKPAVTFLLPGQIVDFDERSNSVISDYQALKSWTATKRSCDKPEFKAALDTIDAFDKSIVASDKGPPPLAVAAELAPLAISKPLTLRLTIEQVGGSAVSRSNIWYAIGLRGAATVSAGLLVSFRLSDPITGMDKLTGLIRCTVPPTGLRDVHHRLAPGSQPNGQTPADRILCGVISG